jgi:anti-sigma factor ChrR (cupin superfamily)
MRLRADFGQRAVVTPDQYEWVPSPAPGVERMMLDRVGEEVARATSIVRYAADSRFPAHEHGGGEEILVLDGQFGDEHGRYPAGYYLRNPIGTGHSPRIGGDGTTIFVKLHQFAADDTAQLAIDTGKGGWTPGPINAVEIQPLHRHRNENVFLLRWAPDTAYPEHLHAGGREILVLDGAFHDEDGHYPRGSWIRYPDGSRHRPYTLAEGALLYVKEGHLPSGNLPQ